MVIDKILGIICLLLGVAALATFIVELVDKEVATVNYRSLFIALGLLAASIYLLRRKRNPADADKI